MVRARKAAGLGSHITLHKLRYSYAAHLLAAGTHNRVIQELLGHKDIKTTLIYTPISSTMMSQVRSLSMSCYDG